VGYTTYIYGLLCPVDNKVHYVGQSRQPVERLRQHLSDTSVSTKEKREWIRDLRAKGMSPELVILETIEWDRHPERRNVWQTPASPLHIERRWMMRLHEAGHPLAQRIPKEPGLTNEEILAQAHERGRKLAAALEVAPRELLEG
jgi:hypothetical protein